VWIAGLHQMRAPAGFNGHAVCSSSLVAKGLDAIFSCHVTALVHSKSSRVSYEEASCAQAVEQQSWLHVWFL
jgi:hypothetical protein